MTSTERGTGGRPDCCVVVLCVFMWQNIKRRGSPVSMEKVEENTRMLVFVFCV